MFFSNGVCEFLILKVHQLSTILTVVYWPPDTILRGFSYFDCVHKDLPGPSPNITLIGDLNLNFSVITWHEVDGVLLPRVAGHRVRCDGKGAK